VTRGQALLLGLLLLGLGAAGYGLFEASGFEAPSAGIATAVLLLLLVVGWTASYLVRVVSGRMTFSEQRRIYRAGYDAQTDAELLARFEALPEQDQARLLAELAANGPATSAWASTALAADPSAGDGSKAMTP
jgi:hypothetical protein